MAWLIVCALVHRCPRLAAWWLLAGFLSPRWPELAAWLLITGFVIALALDAR